MRPQLYCSRLVAVLLVFILLGCKKETENKSCTFDPKLLNGGVWTDLQDASSPPTIKFRFYDNARVTYIFKTATYPALKYDSFPNGRYELVYPDTLRLYDRSWNNYGYIQVLNLSNTELRTRMSGYHDIVVFKKEN